MNSLLRKSLRKPGGFKCAPIFADKMHEFDGKLGKYMGAPQLAKDLDVLHAAAQQTVITDYLSYRDYLRTLYEHLKASEAHYSYQQFAADLGFSYSNVLWLVIAGKRRLSHLAVARIGDSLHFTRSQQRYLELLIKHNNTRDAAQRDRCLVAMLQIKAQSTMDPDLKENLAYFSEWYHPVIRELTAMDEFSSDPKWIADHLHHRILPKQVEKSLRLLEELQLVKYDAHRKRHVSTSAPITPEREVTDHAAIRFHQKMCELAAQSLSDTPEKDREYNTLTVCVSEQEAEEIKAMIYNLCERIAQVERRARHKNRIFQVNLQMFPLSVPIKKGT